MGPGQYGGASASAFAYRVLMRRRLMMNAACFACTAVHKSDTTFSLIAKHVGVMNALFGASKDLCPA
jgi:hypothetical protein